jgi:hypothetical protein
MIASPVVSETCRECCRKSNFKMVTSLSNDMAMPCVVCLRMITALTTAMVYYPPAGACFPVCKNCTNLCYECWGEAAISRIMKFMTSRVYTHGDFWKGESYS